MKRLLIYIAVLAAAVLLISGAMTVRSSARSTEADLPRIYKSIVIETGDTLWDISERYARDFDMNTKEYLAELKRVNGLDSDRIIAGTYLVIICAR